MTRPNSAAGTLWVVATPIGNLADISVRAQSVLGEVSVIAAEDTRVSGRLIERGRDGPSWVVLNEHSETSKIQSLIDVLRQGRDVALVSDAGTPLISDPGYRLVSAAHDAGLRVSPVPGPCAAIAALSAAGLPSDRFWFEGFLPAKTGARRSRLQALAALPVTMIFYVPARDLVAALDDCCAAFGEQRPSALGRELTKLHETVRRASLKELAGYCREDRNQARGEAVLLVGGDCADAATPIAANDLARELAAELPPSRASAVLARLTRLSRKEAWTLIESIRAENPSTPPS